MDFSQFTSKQHLKDSVRDEVWKRFKSPNGKAMVEKVTGKVASRKERRAMMRKVVNGVGK